MYTRNNRSVRDNQARRYNPPPGYTGNTFSVKHHVPEDLTYDDAVPRRDDGYPIGEESEVGSGIRRESNPPDTNPLTCRGEEKNDGSIIEDPAEVQAVQDKSPLHELIHSLQGRIGSEELIILLVLLLITSDGLCAEALILALCLIAG